MRAKRNVHPCECARYIAFMSLGGETSPPKIDPMRNPGLEKSMWGGLALQF